MTIDRGAAALAELITRVDPDEAWGGNATDPYFLSWAKAILGEHGVFLPDGREVEKLRRLAKSGAANYHLQQLGLVYRHGDGNLWECDAPPCIANRETAWTAEEVAAKRAALEGGSE